jgi:methyl-accepting chemotaxis protein
VDEAFTCGKDRPMALERGQGTMKMTVVRKIYLALGGMTLTFIGLAVFSQVTIGKSTAALDEIKKYPELQALLGTRTIDHYKWAEGLGVGALLLGKEFTGQLDHTKCQFGQWYYATKPPAELEETFRKAEEPHRRLHASAVEIVAALKAGQGETARTVYQRVTIPALAETQTILSELRVGVQKMIDRHIASIQAMQGTMGRLSIVVYAVILAALLAGAILFLVRPLRRKLTALTAVLEAVGRGDLSVRSGVDGHDEIADLARAADSMVEQNREVLAQVAATATHVATASRELSAAADQLSSGAQEQAASLEETAASLEQITGTVKQNADNAGQANQLAVGSRETAEKGGQVVTAAVGSMGEINQASRRIADIITTIDEIAFQTNLLALNAAVEAARAGEQGRGFAVVASEVRNLAQRSATAAREITSLIQDSVGKVEAGSALVTRSGETLTEIVGSVKRVTDIIAEIAAASREQTTGIDQLNSTVAQMDQVTQANAAQTEELSSTAQSLAGRAQQLHELVGRFNLGNGRAGSAGARSMEARVLPAPPAPRPAAHERRASHGTPRRVREADAVVLAAARASNGKPREDGFEEF